MVGQNKLQEQFNKFTLTTLPHSLLFIGKYGGGKHLFSKEIAHKFSLQYREINSKINYELIEELNTLVEPTLCVIETKYITLKEEAVLLKFIEEPKSNMYISILAESTAGLSEPILNRCQIFTFSEYTSNELLQYWNTESPIIDETITEGCLLFKIADTPGKLNNWGCIDFETIYEYCNKIFDFIATAYLGNIFKIIDRIDFDSDSSDKYAVEPFFATLLYCAKKRVEQGLPNALKQYLLTDKLLNGATIATLNKKQLFEHYLYDLRGI